MTIDKQEVRRRFGRHATSYDRHAAVQQDMADALVARLAPEPAPRTVLELGCGTGYLTEQLARRWPAARITALDLADTMIDATRRRLGDRGDVELVVGDAESTDWRGRRFDLIVSSATIQWLAAPAATMRRLSAALAPGGLMLHATFGPQTFRELLATLEAAEAARGLPRRRRGLQLMTAAAWSDLLRTLGLTDVQAAERLDVRTYPSCRALLASIRETGASFSPGSGPGAEVLTDAIRRYDADHAGPDGVRATYDVVELSARAPG